MLSMKLPLLTLAMYASISYAADDKKPPPTINCEGEYTMYTHPEKRCREKKAEEYKALIKQLLDNAKKAKEK